MKKIIAAISILAVALLIGSGLVLAYQGDPTKKGPNYSEERHVAMEKAMDNLDYEAWYSLMTENTNHPRVVDVVTKENFPKFVEAHNAIEAGDLDKANEIRKELGLGQGQMKSKTTGSNNGLKKGMNKGMKNNGNCPNLVQ
ncbi:MAG: hypothetical protein WC867_00910 [Candidatus Pacearchaeota archaeon]|jgi:hypothetical protein